MAVDLPSDRKGSDLSRNAEILAEIVDETATRPVESLETACSSIVRELLVRHPYATEASVEASAEYFLRKGVSEAKRSFEDYTLLAEARGTRAEDGTVEVRRAVGAEAVGMTACPCAMETCRELLTKEYPLLADREFESLPMIRTTSGTAPGRSSSSTGETSVEADDVIAAVEAAQSSPTYAILKRGDEAQVVLERAPPSEVRRGRRARPSRQPSGAVPQCLRHHDRCVSRP